MSVQMFQILGRMLKPGDHLKIRCEPCDDLVCLTRADAVARFGEGAMPTEVRQRAECRLCGSSKHINVWI